LFGAAWKGAKSVPSDPGVVGVMEYWSSGRFIHPLLLGPDLFNQGPVKESEACMNSGSKSIAGNPGRASRSRPGLGTGRAGLNPQSLRGVGPNGPEAEIRILLIEDNPGDVRLIKEMLAETEALHFDMQCADCLSTGLSYLAEGNGKSDERSSDLNFDQSSIPGPDLVTQDPVIESQMGSSKISKRTFKSRRTRAGVNRQSKIAFDVVLLDLGLADSEGLDTFIQTHAHSPDVPIIVLTGLQDRMLGIRAVREGAQDYLVKGEVDDKILMKSIHYAVERNRLLVDLRQKSQELGLSRKSFHSIVEKSADGILIADHTGIVQFINSAAICQFRKRREDILGQQFGRPIVSGEVTDVDILRADKTKGLAEMRVVDTEWEGKPAYLAILRDITDRKRAEELLLRQEKLAAMGALASIVSHEIRGPLSVIKNSSEFLKVRLGKSLDEKVSRHLKILKEEVNTADKIIDDILGFARVKDLALTPVDISVIVEATTRRASIPDDVRVIYSLNTDISHVSIDVSQIERVFLNIVNNALDSMCKGGTLTIVSREEKHAKHEGAFVAISFNDTGMGIRGEDLPKVFEPLFTTKSKGTGLGLATCQNIVRAHKGEIQVESKEGEGTTVTVKLPVQGLTNDD
jgi:signal transduction histidine kinase